MSLSIKEYLNITNNYKIRAEGVNGTRHPKFYTVKDVLNHVDCVVQVRLSLEAPGVRRVERSSVSIEQEVNLAATHASININLASSS